MGRRALVVHVADGKLAVLDEAEVDAETGEARLSWRIGNGRPRAVTVRIDESQNPPERDGCE